MSLLNHLVGELSPLDSYTIQEKVQGEEVLWQIKDLSPAEVIIEATRLITQFEYDKAPVVGELVRDHHGTPIILSINRE